VICPYVFTMGSIDRAAIVTLVHRAMMAGISTWSIAFFVPSDIPTRDIHLAHLKDVVLNRGFWISHFVRGKCAKNETHVTFEITTILVRKPCVFGLEQMINGDIFRWRVARRRVPTPAPAS